MTIDERYNGLTQAMKSGAHVDSTLARIDAKRERLRERHQRAMARLDAEEREVLGLSAE